MVFLWHGTGYQLAVTPAGSISFRYNYSINDRQETVTFGRYGLDGISLAEARERLGEAKKMIAAGKSPAKEKARAKARTKGAETFDDWAEKWLRGYHDHLPLAIEQAIVSSYPGSKKPGQVKSISN